MSSRPSRGAARLAAILDALPDALLLVNANGTVVNANSIALEVFETPGTALIGRGLLDLLPAFDSKRIPGSMRRHEDRVEARQPPTRMIARRTDGTELPVEVTSANLEDGRTPYESSFEAAYADHGNSYTGNELLMLVVRDLTGAMDTEAELARQQRQTEMILRAAAEGVVGTDTDGRVVLVNPAAATILGYRASDLGGKKLHPLVHHSRADGSPLPYEETPLADTLRSGRKHRVRGQVLWARDGHPIPVDMTTAPVRDGDQLVGAVLTFTDRRSQDALEARQAQLLAVVEDALRGPLEQLRRELAGLAADPAGQLWPEANQTLHRLAAGHARMTTLVDNIVNYQRLDTGLEKLDRRQVAVDAVIATGVEGAVELIGPGRAQFAVHAPPIDAEVDPDRLALAIAHLIADVAGVDATGNAPAGGGDSTIVVAAAKRGGQGGRDGAVVRIEVRGPHRGGSGVHAPLVRGIVEMHGGVLQTHEVPGSGGGSAFVLEVPVGTVDENVARRRRAAEAAPAEVVPAAAPVPAQQAAVSRRAHSGRPELGPVGGPSVQQPRPAVPQSHAPQAPVPQSLPPQPPVPQSLAPHPAPPQSFVPQPASPQESVPAPRAEIEAVPTTPTGRRARRALTPVEERSDGSGEQAAAGQIPQQAQPGTGRRGRRAKAPQVEEPAVPGARSEDQPRVAFALPPAEADRGPAAPAAAGSDASHTARSAASAQPAEAPEPTQPTAASTGPTAPAPATAPAARPAPPAHAPGAGPTTPAAPGGPDADGPHAQTAEPSDGFGQFSEGSPFPSADSASGTGGLPGAPANGASHAAPVPPAAPAPLPDPAPAPHAVEPAPAAPAVPPPAQERPTGRRRKPAPQPEPEPGQQHPQGQHAQGVQPHEPQAGPPQHAHAQAQPPAAAPAERPAGQAQPEPVPAPQPPQPVPPAVAAPQPPPVPQQPAVPAPLPAHQPPAAAPQAGAAPGSALSQPLPDAQPLPQEVPPDAHAPSHVQAPPPAQPPAQPGPPPPEQPPASPPQPPHAAQPQPEPQPEPRPQPPAVPQPQPDAEAAAEEAAAEEAEARAAHLRVAASPILGGAVPPPTASPRPQSLPMPGAEAHAEHASGISVRTLGQGVPFTHGPEQHAGRYEEQAAGQPLPGPDAAAPQQTPPAGTGRRRRLAAPATETDASEPHPPTSAQQQATSPSHESHEPQQPHHSHMPHQAQEPHQPHQSQAPVAAPGAEPRQQPMRQNGAPSPAREFAIGAPDAGLAEGPEPLDGPNGAVEVTETGHGLPQHAERDDELPPEPLDNPRRLLVWPEPDVSTQQALTQRGYRPVLVHSREEVDAQIAAYPAALFVDPLTGPITRTALQSLRQAAVAAEVPVLVTAGLGQASREAAYGADPAVLLKALAPRDSEQHPPRVLLVEEQPAIAQAFAATLERRGMQVAHAPTDAEAAGIAAQIRPNLVVMDLCQVRRRRAGVIDWLRVNGLLNRTPFVVYTSAGLDPNELPRLASGETVLFLAERSTSDEVQSRIVDLLAKIGAA